MRICFDMDGTIANFYGVANWLEYIKAEDITPYAIAKPLVNFATLARLLNKAQRNGNELVIITWTAKNGTATYNEAVGEVKKAWLKKHLPSVRWDEINVINYGTNKDNYRKEETDLLFDDEEPNRKAWNGKAYNADRILEVLKTL